MITISKSNKFGPLRQTSLKREKPLHSPQLDAISEHSERLNTGRNSLSKKSAGDLIEDPRKMQKKRVDSRQGADSSEDDEEHDRSYRLVNFFKKYFPQSSIQCSLFCRGV